MAIEKAQIWMRQHSHIIPALEITYQEISLLLEQEHQAHNLVKYSIRDPGLSLALLIKVNAGRNNSTSRDPIESPQSAISLLGDRATTRVFNNTLVAEKNLKNPEQLDAFLQIINRCFHNEVQAENWAKLNGYNHIEPIKLASLLGYIGELLCCAHDYKNYQRYLSAKHSGTNEEHFFNFQFDELSIAVATKFNLPDLILRSIPLENATGQRSQLIKYLNLICKYSEENWYSEKMLETQRQFAEFLKLPLDKVIKEIHQNAIKAARSTLLPQLCQTASRLILLPDIIKPEVKTAPQPEPIAEIQTAQPDHQQTQKKIRELLQNPQCNQSEILNACIHGLHHEMGLSKISLLLLSKDRQHLNSRMTFGVNPDSPLKHFSIDLDKAGLFKALLNKPLAIWINNNTFAKYHKAIPQSFLASIMTNHFFAMSLFINERALGIIYADLSDSSKELNEALFKHFKQTVTICSKALSFLAKNHKPH